MNAAHEVLVGLHVLGVADAEDDVRLREHRLLELDGGTPTMSQTICSGSERRDLADEVALALLLRPRRSRRGRAHLHLVEQLVQLLRA